MQFSSPRHEDQHKVPSRDHLGEDGGHLFFKCKVAKHLWRLFGLEAERIELASVQTALGAVEVILKAREQKKLLMITTLWFTAWSERNMIREEGRWRCPRTLARSVELYVKEMDAPASLP